MCKEISYASSSNQNIRIKILLIPEKIFRNIYFQYVLLLFYNLVSGAKYRSSECRLVDGIGGVRIIAWGWAQVRAPLDNFSSVLAL